MILPLSDVVAVASGTPFVGGCVFPVLCFRFLPAAASSALCAFSRRRLCASCPVSGVPLAPSLPVLACAPAALAAVLRAVRAGFIGSPRHLTRLPMRRFGGAGAPFSPPVRAGSRRSPRLRRASGAKSAGFQNIASSLMRRRRRGVSSFGMPFAFRTARTESVQGLKSESLSPSPQERRSAQSRQRVKTSCLCHCNPTNFEG